MAIVADERLSNPTMAAFATSWSTLYELTDYDEAIQPESMTARSAPIWGGATSRPSSSRNGASRANANWAPSNRTAGAEIRCNRR